MKLIECYIENFGRLSSYTHVFSDGLNVIIGKNGCGKTTLSVFIKSMLYGIESKKNKGEETDRKRYMPWQGGRCGGSLTFESNGKKYRIERTFGDKASADVFAIYNAETGAETTDFSEKVGEELFDIDADGFERTVFLSERKFSVNGNNPTISAKLSNLVGVDGDMGSFDAAIDKLEKREKFYRHRRGKGGLVGDIKSEISNIDGEILSLNRKKADCANAEEKLSAVALEIEKAEILKRNIEKEKLDDAYKKEYLARKTSLATYEERLEKEKRFFGDIPPSSEQIRYYEQKRNQALILKESVEKEKENLNSNSDDICEETDRHLRTLERLKNHKNANNSCLLYALFVIFIAVCAVALGLIANPFLYLISIIDIPLVYLCVKSLKNGNASDSNETEIKEISDFVKTKTGKSVPQNMLDSVLRDMKADAVAQKRESERLVQSIRKNEELAASLTEEYTAFLSKFDLVSKDAFGELREHLSAYENLLRETAMRAREAELYAAERGILSSETDFTPPAFSAVTLENTEETLRSLRSERYTLESRLSSLYDELSREDELKERRLELADELDMAESAHKITVKAAEHLGLAKERLTSKYLGKMRTAFDYYISRIGEEEAKSFTLDSDFSLRKTENGLTNPISSYSLGTKELYSLATRLALIDALYEKNSPFIVLDDPFCHFDDRKCEAAINAIKEVAKEKQIIYLTCAEVRTPK